MGNDAFDHEYDLESLRLVSPRGHEFSMYVTPRYRHHYETQEYERYTARLVARVLSRHSLFIDVGANYGFYTLLAATQHPRLEVLALEPVEATFEVLKLNAGLLALSKVHLHQLAAADADGTASFHISMAADNCGFSPHPAAPPLREVEVRTARLDTLLADRTPCPLLVKIDVEGHELAVLRGMKDTFSRFPDLSLVVEFNPKVLKAAGTRPEDLLLELDRLGFSVFLLDDERCLPHRLKPESRWEASLGQLGYANLYCVRKETALNLSFFSHGAQLTGAEQSLLQLVKELVAGYGVVCTVVLPGSGPLVQSMEEAGAACIVAQYGWWGALSHATVEPGALRQLESQIQALARDVLPTVSQIDPDFLWTQTLVIPWGAVVAALLGKPHVWSVCEYGELDHGIRFFAPFTKVLEDIMASSAFVYTCGKTLGETLFPGAGVERWQTLHRNIEVPVLPGNPVPTGLFRREGALRLAVFATLHPNKGQEDAIRAVAELTAEGRDVELLLAGHVNPERRPWLEALIAKHGLQDRVRTPGFVADRFPAMRETDIILVCSRREAFGRVGVEAMLLGKPVIYASAGGSLEYMVDGHTGLSYPPGDAGALAAAIRHLAADPGARQALGRQAQTYARARFSREAYGGEVFRKLCGLRAKSCAGAIMPSIVQPLVGSALSELATLKEQAGELVTRLEAARGELTTRLEATKGELTTRLEATKGELTTRLEAAKGEIDDLRRTVASAEQWQRRWVKRAFSRWHPPGMAPERVGWLKRLERSLRKRRKRLAKSIRRIWAPPMRALQLTSYIRTYAALNRQHAGAVTLVERVRCFFPWARSLKNSRSAVRDQNIWVVFKANSFIGGRLKPGMKVFEYGTGGSTLYFLQKRCTVCSVEHHPQWFQTVAAEIARRAYPGWQGFLREPDKEVWRSAAPGAQCTYRSAFGEYQGRLFSEYVKVIDQFVENSFDVVFIDGRARDSCFVHAYKKVKPGGILILDNSERRRYQLVHETLEHLSWVKHRFFGPGPYVSHEFWETTVWTRPG